MFTFLCIVAMLMSKTLTHFIRDEKQELAVRAQIYNNWGSFTRALVTMFEVTLANWGPVCWTLTNSVNEWYSLFFVCYKCTIGLAVVQVILAVFIQQTFKVASDDEEIMLCEQKQQTESMVRHMMHLFDLIDTNHDNIISTAEFEKVMDNVRVKTWFSAIGVDGVDLRDLFTMLDDGDGQLDESEFIEGVNALRGFAKSIDIFVIKRQLKKVQDLVLKIHDCVSERSYALE